MKVVNIRPTLEPQPVWTVAKVPFLTQDDKNVPPIAVLAIMAMTMTTVLAVLREGTDWRQDLPRLLNVWLVVPANTQRPLQPPASILVKVAQQENTQHMDRASAQIVSRGVTATHHRRKIIPLALFLHLATLPTTQMEEPLAISGAPLGRTIC